MDFKIKPRTKNVTIGTTAKGNTIEYEVIPTDNLKFWQPSADLSKIDLRTAGDAELRLLNEDNKVYKKASKIRLECGFIPTVAMLDILVSSKILSISDYSRSMQIIDIIPHPLFDYGKLNDVLFDLTNKFDL